MGQLADMVTTVVIARDGGDTLKRTMALHDGPVIYVDNGSSDGSPDAVAELQPQADVVRLPANAGAPARNIGVLRARTPFVAFADDDSWWAPGALDRAAAVLREHPDVAVVAAHILVGGDEHPDLICAQMLDSPLPARPEIPGRSVAGFVACAAVVRREAFLAAGGFDDVVFFMGEEERLTLDLLAGGWDLVYVPGVVAHHDPQPSRDRSGRAATMHRNSLLTAVMRHHRPVVLQRTGAALRTPAGRSALAAASRRIPEALRRRSAVPDHVEQRLELVREKRFSAENRFSFRRKGTS